MERDFVFKKASGSNIFLEEIREEQQMEVDKPTQETVTQGGNVLAWLHNMEETHSDPPVNNNNVLEEPHPIQEGTLNVSYENVAQPIRRTSRAIKSTRRRYVEYLNCRKILK